MKGIVLREGESADDVLIHDGPRLMQIVRWLQRCGINEVMVNPGQSTIAQDDIGADSGMDAHYSIGAQPSGSADILKQLGSFFDTTTVVLYDRVDPNFDLGALLDYHQARNALLTLGLTHTATPQLASMVECDSSGRVTRFVERPAIWMSDQHTASLGVYIVEPAILDHIPDDRVFDWEEHLIPLLLAAGEAVYGQIVDELADDVR